ncbi:MAG: amidohydrolase [Candidatus Thermoplasmatota archaeon]|nr:amidohydrolase [Candidatus Thermoplasmatota archaeon]MBS3790078.1 amidohydrolase [Candidatus Thermoplasmatota archaeon]
MVEEGKIKNIDNFDRIMGKSEEKIDLKGDFVLPGFIDSHTHLVEEGLDMERVDLLEVETLEGAQYYLEKEVSKTPEEEWIVGVNFDESAWKMNDYPTKEDLDEVTEEHPLIIKRICGHVAVANSNALDMIREDWNKVDREKGLLREEVVWNLDDIMSTTKKEKIEAIKRAIQKVQSNGITSVHDVVDRGSWEAYEELDEKEDLDLRVNCYLHYDEAEGLYPTEVSDFLSLRGLKMYADGSIGARTAALHEEYEDDPGNRGLLLLSREEMEDIIKDAEEKNFQMMTHAIGDRAISTVLDAFENASTKNEELRHRIEHAEMLWEENIKRIRDLSMVLSTQPNYAYKWSSSTEMNEKRLGKERLKKCNPYWDIQRALIDMAFGSDNIFLSPFFNIYCATNHPILNQRISTYNALKSYISAGAYASRNENKYGSFEEGKMADFVVLSENPLEAKDVRDIEVKMTVVGGKIVYEDSEEDRLS